MIVVDSSAIVSAITDRSASSMSSGSRPERYLHARYPIDLEVTP